MFTFFRRGIIRKLIGIHPKFTNSSQYSTSYIQRTFTTNNDKGNNSSPTRPFRIGELTDILPTAGVVNIDNQVHVDVNKRLFSQNHKPKLFDDIFELAHRSRYFVVYGGRQIGKSTTMKNIVQTINKDPTYNMLAIMPSLQEVNEKDTKVDQLHAVKLAIETSINDCMEDGSLSKDESTALISSFESIHPIKLKTGLTELTKAVAQHCEGKRLFIAFDEADTLSDSAMISFLGALRTGYNNRDTVSFPHSVALIGVQHNEYYAHGHASPFNIADAYKLDWFSQEDVNSVLTERWFKASSELAKSTGNDVLLPEISKEAAKRIYFWTQGHPLLVNTMAKEAILKNLVDAGYREITPISEIDPKNKKYHRIIEPKDIDSVVGTMISQRTPHYSHIRNILRNEDNARGLLYYDRPDKRKVEAPSYDIHQKLVDNGLVSKSKEVISNPFYERLLPILAAETLFGWKDSTAKLRLAECLNDDGSVNLHLVLEQFVEYWTGPYARNPSRYGYGTLNQRELEPALHLRLFLRPILNGGGIVLYDQQLSSAAKSGLIPKKWLADVGSQDKPDLLLGYDDQFSGVIEVKFVSKKKNTSFTGKLREAENQMAGYREALCGAKTDFSKTAIIVFDDEIEEEDIIIDDNKDKPMCLHLPANPK